jgi:glycerophosphoryl diester phosphodiesterase
VKTKIIAHRGASQEAPENTMAAFRLAWEQGADGIELDVQVTKDGQLVVFHDDTTRRTTGVPGRMAEHPSASVLRFDAGLWKHARWKGERVPLLSEVLAEAPSERRVFIELKAGAEIMPELDRILAGSPLIPEQRMLMGFDFDLMVKVREQFPDGETGWIIDRPWKSARLERILESAKAAAFPWLHFSSEWPLDEAMLGKVHDAGFQVSAWTVDEPRHAQRLASLGIDAIITNEPLRIRAALQAHAI